MRDLIVGLCIVKNEADIIEPMVRHNLAFVDHLHLVDNDSSDGTLRILKLLSAEYPDRLTWSEDKRPGHRQKDIINSTLSKIAPAESIAHVVLLDADECIRGDRTSFRTGLLGIDVPVLLPWVTFLPTGSDGEELNPVLRMVCRRELELPQYFKVTVPGRLIGKVIVKAGSHVLKGADVPTPVELAGITLAHFPVRSREQLMSKVLIGSWSVRFRGPLKGKEAYHWHALAARILAGDMLGDTDIHSIALNYAAEKEAALVRDPLPHHCGTLRYTEDGSHLLLRNLIAFAESCVTWRESHQPKSQAGGR
ncbi:glycosyltransferase family 2 protein [Tabrizicola sp. BL-A-41-H6]|uniref:glycosyltransferase family 2 protein n=1 Tax=Tabrizicola sp. BL-A-41-H6 TaxID=3421107 RepID=UPI003D6722DE